MSLKPTGADRTELKKGEASLVCLLQALEKSVLIVELKSGALVTGEVESVDGDMNIAMHNVQMQHLDGKIESFDVYFVVGRFIRMVELPDDLAVEQTIKQRIGTTERAGRAYQRKPKRKAAERR
eukprot:m.355915 g.355915  ORF g.355915 m.355915 type:complete len:124 (+) comp17386_c0_seq1:66-437(+)